MLCLRHAQEHEIRWPVPACYALVEPDDQRPRANREREKRIPLYQHHAEWHEPLFGWIE